VTRYPGELVADIGLARLSCGALLQLDQEVRSGTSPALGAIPRASRYGSLHLGVSQFDVVFQFIGGHDADDGDAILFKDEVLVAVMSAPGNLAEIDARLGNGKPVDGGH